MICLTGNERSLRQIENRIQTAPNIELHELRLDLLDHIDDDVFDFIRSFSHKQLLVTCRPDDEGGGFKGAQAHRLEIFHKALAARPAWVDIERDAPVESRHALWQSRGATKILVSLHLREEPAPPTLLRETRRLGNCEGDGLKLALPVRDAARLAGLLDLEVRDHRPWLKIGMGSAGLLSRAMYSRFHSPWTYACIDANTATAPGQLTLDQAKLYRMEQGDRMTPLGVLGGEQVMRSKGSLVYNRLFPQYDLDYRYLPVVSEDPGNMLPLMERLGFQGCAVTMPDKQRAAQLMTRLEPPADEIGAINTIRFDDGERLGANTDVIAMQRIFEPFVGMYDDPALVLGAGGAARAAVWALKNLGFKTTIANHHDDKARALAKELGAQAVDWEDRGNEQARFLVNATPLGMDGESQPMPQNTGYQNRVVLDMVYGARPTPWQESVKRGGGKIFTGLDMWCLQGVEQMARIIGHKFSTEQLREIATQIDEESHDD